MSSNMVSRTVEFGGGNFGNEKVSSAVLGRAPTTLGRKSYNRLAFPKTVALPQTREAGYV